MEPHKLRQAAVLVASLDSQAADRLLDRLPAETAAQIRRLAVELAAVDPQEEQTVCAQFLREHDERLSAQEASAAAARAARPAPSGEAAARRLRAVPRRTEHEPPFRFLHDAHEAPLAAVLSHERPQTVAVVLSHLPAERAAEVLDELPAQLQTEVLGRLVRLDEADPDILREVEAGLQERLRGQWREVKTRAAGLAAVERILSAAPPGARQRILGGLREHDHALAARFERRPLRFADLLHWDGPSLVALFRAAPSDVAVLALAAAPPELVARLRAHMPGDEAQALQTALENLGPTRLSDVEEAQRQWALLAQHLHEEDALRGTGATLAMVA